MKELSAITEIDMHLINDILSEKNVANLKYETVEDFGYFVYNTKTKEGNYVNAFFDFLSIQMVLRPNWIYYFFLWQEDIVNIIMTQH